VCVFLFIEEALLKEDTFEDIPSPPPAKESLRKISVASR